MSKRIIQDPKQAALKTHGTLHPRPEQITDELFQDSDFFDPRDMIQVKYEMLRRVRVDRMPISRVAQKYGFSRPTVYKVQRAFARAGLIGLVPAKPGPRHAHKLSEPVMDFIEQELAQDGTLDEKELASRIEAKFNIVVHPRSIRRARCRKEKKSL